MTATKISASRLRREDCKHTKHDSVFSKWEILIGFSDWEDHSLGKEGTERYRIHNLPVRSSCPGIYELGVAVSHTDTGRKVRKLDPDRTVVVYLGHTDNVRTRLQYYGRVGSHLDHGNSIAVSHHLNENGTSCIQRGPGLFKEIFSRGYSIVFRWAPRDSKREAEKIEAQLLGVFDYAWNKGGNGIRRPNDILVKIDKISSSTNIFPDFAVKLQQWKWNVPFGKNQVGIRVKANKPLSEKTNSDTCDTNSDDIRSRIFKFSRSLPQLISGRVDTSDESVTVCGVALGDGFICRRQPTEGRKRCGEHKGKRINGLITKSVTGQSLVCGVSLEDGSFCLETPIHGRKRCELHKGKSITSIPLTLSVTKGESFVCGVRFEDGSFCMEVPVNGRKRCELHKGRRVTSLPVFSETDFAVLKTQSDSDKFVVNEENITICGVVLGDGSVCRRLPNEGRKRCQGHKGKKITVFMTRFETEGKSLVCGVGLEDGSVCMEVPVHGRKRCDLHKGRRAT